MRIANGVEMLEISTASLGRAGTINPTLLWDDESVILVDAGFPGQLPLIREAAEQAGVSLDGLKAIIITHHDIDHIGGLSAILKELPNAAVLAHETEEPYINGEKRPLKLAAMEARLDTLPENMKVMYERMKAGFQNGLVDVNRALTDGEELPYCGGIRIVFTPGHTLGHICLYLKQSKTLIAGDLLRIEDGRLSKADPAINHDNDLVAKSLKKLAEYDIENVICYHGGLYRGGANERIAELKEGAC